MTEKETTKTSNKEYKKMQLRIIVTTIKKKHVKTKFKKNAKLEYKK